MYSKIKYILSIFIIVHISLLHAQVIDDFKFEHLTIKDGLSFNYTYHTLKDKWGYLWFSTALGLNRYDGKNFRHFRYDKYNKHSISADEVYNTAIDSSNILWIASVSGLCNYNPYTDVINRITIDPADSIEGIGRIMIDSRNRLWTSVFNKGIYCIQLSGIGKHKLLMFHPFKDEYDEEITTIMEDADGSVWLSSQKYLYKFTGLKAPPKEILVSTNVSYNNYLNIRAMHRDAKGHLWMGCYDYFGLIEYNEDKNSFTNYPYKPPGPSTSLNTYINKIRYIYEETDKNGDILLWCCTIDNGIEIFNTETKKYIKNFMPADKESNNINSSYVRHIFKDSDDNYWIAGDQGVNKLSFHNQKLKTFNLSGFLKPNESNEFWNIVPDKDFNTNKIIWISTGAYVFLKYNTATNKAIVYKTNLANSYFIFQQSDGTIWIGGTSIVSFNPYTQTFKYYTKYNYDRRSKSKTGIRDISEPFPGFISICDDGRGLEIIDTKNNTSVSKSNTPFLKHLFAGKKVSMLRGLDSNYLFVACLDTTGFSIINIKNKTVRYFNKSDNEDTLWQMQSFLRDKDLLWLGTGQGVYTFNLTTNALNYHPLSLQLLHKSVRSLQADSTGIWICTILSVEHFNKKLNKIDIVLNINNSLGFLTGPYMVLSKGAANNFYLPYNNGIINWFNAADFTAINKPSPIIFTSAEINGQQALYIDSANNYNYRPLVVPPGSNQLSLGFACMDLSNPSTSNYAYYLEPSDTAWHYINTERTVNFADLSPGVYTLHIKASNSNNIWNEQGNKIEIRVLPYFWQTWVFKTLIVLLAGITVIFFVRRKIRQIRLEEARKSEVAKMISETEMKALRSQMNPHFIFNSLNSIQTYIWENKQEEATGYLNKFSKLIRMILEYSMLKLITLEQEIEALTLYIELEHRRCNNKFDYTISVDKTIDASLTLVPPLILQPYVENAIWHGLLPAGKQGKLSLMISLLYSGVVVFTIEDNGIGRSAAQEIKKANNNTKKSYGMQITGQRIIMSENSNHSGTVVIKDLFNNNNQPSGTMITITLPIEKFEKV